MQAFDHEMVTLANNTRVVVHFNQAARDDLARSKDVSPATRTPLLCLHGNSQDATTLMPLAREPWLDWPVIMLDLPGHGLSPPAADPEATYSVPGYAAVLRSLLAHLQLPEVCLLGHSLGGHVILEALPYLQGVHGIILTGSPPTGVDNLGRAFLPAEAAAALFSATMEDRVRSEAADDLMRGVPRAQVATLLDIYDRTDPQARTCLAASLQAGRVADGRRILVDSGMPCLYLHGTEDPLISGDYVREVFSDCGPQARLDILEGQGHWPQLEAPDVFASRVFEFVSVLNERAEL
ncbi:alpha/beta hydrolase [Natronospirillum operosum]|uniref:Alpha/beta hydrolase n=1 Tax=Natronospirillum operosum TaxID=2759953 RepID=A0A4Z0WDI0_9GAMM|nr:alpha/beta hydrolase [Natronospirillum operosum]TGG92028.1 alpha/beta hydrolase [Natronospirillum operosum]